MSFNFMAAVTIRSDFGDKKMKSVTVSTVSPSVYHELMMILFLVLEVNEL